MATRKALPVDIEEFRDVHWCRDERYRVETVEQAEQFVEEVGFATTFTDSRKPGPSLYVAVCGRRDVVMPRNVQTDPETSLTWRLKDELMRRGRVYYAKLARGKTMCIAPRMIPWFKALWGVGRRQEKAQLSPAARDVLRVLRREWEMATPDLRAASGVTDRQTFNRAIDELQAAMVVVPGEAVYQPRFTYLWTMATERFPEQLAVRSGRAAALSEIARCFLEHAGETRRGELARATGLSRRDAGLGNRALVDEGFAVRVADGVYRLASLDR